MHFLLFRKFKRRKSTRIALEFVFLVPQMFAMYKIINTLKLFWFNFDSSVLVNKGVQFFFHDICHFFICIADCQTSRYLKLNLFSIFRVFCITGSFAFYVSTMLEEEVCQVGHKHGDINLCWIAWIQIFLFLVLLPFFLFKRFRKC